MSFPPRYFRDCTALPSFFLVAKMESRRILSGDYIRLGDLESSFVVGRRSRPRDLFLYSTACAFRCPPRCVCLLCPSGYCYWIATAAAATLPAPACLTSPNEVASLLMMHEAVVPELLRSRVNLVALRKLARRSTRVRAPTPADYFPRE